MVSGCFLFYADEKIKKISTLKIKGAEAGEIKKG